jgi:hypothetical protein
MPELARASNAHPPEGLAPLIDEQVSLLDAVSLLLPVVVLISDRPENWYDDPVGAAVRVRPMPTDIARYSIELFQPDGEAIEEILDRHADLKVARSI